MRDPKLSYDMEMERRRAARRLAWTQRLAGFLLGLLILDRIFFHG